jgi:hypothetical protein
MSTPCMVMLLHIKSEDIPCKPITMNDQDFFKLYKKYEDRFFLCESRGAYIFDHLTSVSEKLNLSGLAYIKSAYAILDKTKCLCAVHDIDFLLRYFAKTPEFVTKVFNEGFSPEEILEILNLSDSELFERAKPDGDNFYNCVSYLRDQRRYLDSVQNEDGIAMHVRSVYE